MAEDLASTSTTGLRVQACGDAHLLNFGVFATPERRLVFDVNDFDETLPAPFEWDVKRLATSVVLAGRLRGFDPGRCVQAARAAATGYRSRVRTAATLGHLDVWYARLDVDELTELTRKARARRVQSGVIHAAHRASSLGALNKLTESVDGRRRIADSPPLVEHLAPHRSGIDPDVVVRRYRSSLTDATQALLGRYRVVDWARKVVGIGSVGMRDAIVLLLGETERDPLFLQAKEARASVLERFAGPGRHANQGQRVVAGQRLMQTASDIFLGWTRVDGRDYYVRQLRDMKASVPIAKLTASELTDYARLCGVALGQAHARSGDPAAIAAYLGRGERFDRAIGAFAVAYADQTERDYAAFTEVLRPGCSGS